MLDSITWYTPLFITLFILVVTFYFSDWRNWRKYYPTILFIIVVSFTAYVLTYDYPLWLYHESLFIPNRLIHEFRLDFLALPGIILLYLTLYPYTSGMLRKLTYILIWTVILSIFEGFYVLLKILTYHNGWNIGWSVVTWFIKFSVVIIHHRKPKWAWLICVIIIIFVINYFDIPFSTK